MEIMTLVMAAVFILGYIFIAIESKVELNKAATALLTGVVLWTVYVFMAPDRHHVLEQFAEHVGDWTGILFFLMGAMTIVELMDSHNAFDVLTDAITMRSKRKLLWVIAFTTFFLSSVLDNLTTTIVMISLITKMIKDKEDVLMFAGIIIIAANAGGAWSPIGDVTTTMLWVNGQITTFHIMQKLIFPSLISLVLPLIAMTFMLKGEVESALVKEKESLISKVERDIIFFLGLGALIFVPVFKSLTHLPPFVGVLFGLSILWIVTEVMHKHKETKHEHSVASALHNIDMASVLFFLGILSAVSALQSAGILGNLALYLDSHLRNPSLEVVIIGIVSAIVDNVPLVAAAMGMYDLTQFAPDSSFWTGLAFCAGTGGSILVIGSAAGVAAMSLVKIDFMWYLKKIAPLALLGYFAGAISYFFIFK